MSVSGKIETTANLATIVVAVLISATLVKAHFFPNPPARTVTTVSAPVSQIVPGKTLDGRALGVDWARNRSTLVLAMSTACHFCKDSLPFYRELAAARTDVKLVAVMPQPVAEGRKFLIDSNVPIDEVRQISLNTIGVAGTPTLLLVNGAGVIAKVWVGKLQTDGESQVLSALGTKKDL